MVWAASVIDPDVITARKASSWRKFIGDGFPYSI
jgi:hypothetical protein